MPLSHPFEKIPAGRIRYYAIPLVGITVAILAMFPWIIPDRDTQTLLDLVGAGSAERAAAVLSHWSVADRVRAAFGVGIDFLLNPAYATAAALGCIWASRSLGAHRLSLLGVPAAWVVSATIVTNLFENVALFRMLLDDFSGPWPAIASGAHIYAGVALFGVGLPYLLLGVYARWRAER